MKFLFLALGVLMASVAVALFAVEDPGYVLITRGPWVIETSLGFAATAIAIAFILGYGIVRLAILTWNLPRRLRARRRHRRMARARYVSRKGMLALVEGHWKVAERDLLRAAEYDDDPLLNYLGAARAAQRQHAAERRDHYLSLAHRAVPDAELAVGLTQAEMRMAQGQEEQALATLVHLRSLAPKHPHVMYLLRQLHEQLGAWKELEQLLPDLRRNDVLAAAEIDALERIVYSHLLELAGSEGQLAGLRGVWETVPRDLRQDAVVAGAFARSLACLGKSAEAEELLRDVLKRHWEPELVRLYGLVRGSDLNRQLAAAESWLKHHERNPVLLLTLGRICLQNRLWGKARTYLEASLGMEPRAETYRELGLLLFQFKEQEKAAEHFRKGLEIAVGLDACTAFKVEEAAALPRRER